MSSEPAAMAKNLFLAAMVAPGTGGHHESNGCTRGRGSCRVRCRSARCPDRRRGWR
jgi:hypothetical protein